jgi:uncharacterized membrane protein
MSRSKTRATLSSRVRKRRFIETVEFPRGLLTIVVLLVGFVLLVAGLSEPSGELKKPGLGAYIYIAAVVGVAAYLLFAHRKGHSVGKRRPERVSTDRDS